MPGIIEHIEAFFGSGSAPFAIIMPCIGFAALIYTFFYKGEEGPP